MKYLVEGDHNLLPEIRNHLSSCGYTEVKKDPDMLLCGIAEGAPEDVCQVPTLIVSTSRVYTCLDAHKKVRPIGTFSEDEALVVPSTQDWSASEQSLAIYNEAKALRNRPNSLLVRPFSVYGHGRGTIDHLHKISQAGAPLPILLSGRRKKSFTYIDDFLHSVMLLTNAMMTKHVRGVYNVGNPAALTMEEVAATLNAESYLITKPKNTFVNFWKIPDTARLKAITGYVPATSLRKGLWLMGDAT